MSLNLNASLGITMTFCNGQLDLIVLDWSLSTVAFVWAPFRCALSLYSLVIHLFFP